MSARRRAHVHQLGACVAEQTRERRIGRGTGERGELSRCGFLGVAHGDDSVGGKDPPEGAQVEVRHSASPHDGDAEFSVGLREDHASTALQEGRQTVALSGGARLSPARHIRAGAALQCATPAQHWGAAPAARFCQ